MRVTVCGLLLATVVVQACATGGGPRTSAYAVGTVITQAEIARSSAGNAQEIVDRLRPEWLVARDDASISGDIGQTLVYLNDQRFGPLASLRDIPVEMVGAIELLTGGREQALLVGDAGRSTSTIIRIIGPTQVAARNMLGSGRDAPRGFSLALYPIAGSSPIGDRAHAGEFTDDGWVRTHSPGGPYSLMASARMALTRTASLELIASRRLARETETFQRGATFIHHTATATTAGVLAAYNAGPVRISAGPVGQLTELEWAAGECECISEGSKNALVGGAAFDIATSLPRFSALSLELRVQGRWLRGARIHGFQHLPAYDAGGKVWFVGLGAGWQVSR
jgi:hypothetical protein